MTIKQYDEMIKGHIDKKDFVKIRCTVTDGEADISGFIYRGARTFF